MPTGIPYCDETWNPIIGCTKIASGCANCWAEKLHTQRHKAYWAGRKLPVQYSNAFGEIRLRHERLEQPLHWRKPRTIFVNSMSDTFHEDVPDEFLYKMWNIFYDTPRHTYQLFTKRFSRALDFADYMAAYYQGPQAYPDNVHVFFSVSTQAELDNAVPILLQIPAAVRGLSLEPLLGPIDLGRKAIWTGHEQKQALSVGMRLRQEVHCVIVGCESGPNRRPCEWKWIRNIVEQCKEAGVCCYAKQIEIDGKVVTDPKKFPKDLRVRQYPGKD